MDATMTIQDLGAIGEIIGAVAVIASVIYLAVQIHNGLRGYQSVITQETTNHFSRLQLDIARDPVLSDLMYRAYSGAELGAFEMRRLGFLLSSYMIAYENLYAQHCTGMLAKGSYEARRRSMASMLAPPAGWHWWQSDGVYSHPADFIAEVSVAIEDYRASKLDAEAIAAK